MALVTTQEFEQKIAPATMLSSLYIVELGNRVIGQDVSDPRVVFGLEYADSVGGIARTINFDPEDPDSVELLHLNLRHIFGTKSFIGQNPIQNQQ